MSLSISMRPYRADDHEAVTALYYEAKPLGVGPPQAQSDFRHRHVAVEDATGQIVGLGQAGDGDPSSLGVMVRPDWQRRGVGRALWARLQEALVLDSVANVETWVREENAAGVAWLSTLGFVPVKLDGPVRLVLPEARPVATDMEATLAAQDITITTLAEEKPRDSQCLSKLHSLYTTVEADVPGHDPANKSPWEDFAREWEQPDRLLFLAKDGEQYVGLSTGAPRSAGAFFEERHDIFQQHLTGVLPAYRRRGIATALKQRVIAHAQAGGYHSLWTNSDNPAMCALNKKLGFRSGPWRIYNKSLTRSQ